VTFEGPQSAGGKREDREMHRDRAMVTITFNPRGTRCVTTDADGVVGVWKTDHKGMLNQICHYRKPGVHDKIVFRTNSPSGEPNLDNPPFFFGGDSDAGAIYLADDMGLCSERNKVGASLLFLDYFHERDQVIAITRNAMFMQFSIDPEGKVVNERNQKLNIGGNPETLQGVWAGAGLLATTAHESVVRLWNLVDDENYILTLHGLDKRSSTSTDKVTSIDFNSRKRVLACGTKDGRVVQWRCSTLATMPNSDHCWQALPVISVLDCAIDRIRFGPGEKLLHARTDRSHVVLNEAQLNTAVQRPYLAMQTTPTQVLLHHLERQSGTTVKVPFHARGLSLCGMYLMLYSDKQVNVFEIAEHSMTANDHSSFGRENAPITSAVLFAFGMEGRIAIASGAKIELTNLLGHMQRAIQFSPQVEGCPTCLAVNGGAKGMFLVASTSANVIRLWKVSRNEEKQVGNPRVFEGANKMSLGDIRSVRVNIDGTRVSLLVDHYIAASDLGPGGAGSAAAAIGRGEVRVPDTRVFVYDVESDNFLSYMVGKHRVPISHTWDCGDPRLFACEVVTQLLAYEPPAEDDNSKASAIALEDLRKGEGEGEEPSQCVKTLFVARAEAVLLQDTISCSDPQNPFSMRMPVALLVPHMYFARSAQEGEVGRAVGAEQETSTITRQTLRDFVGLEHVDAETTSALLNFSYHLACGNTDEAYKSVKMVQSKNVWESMSKMCVKTGRLDVVQQCLGHMGHARAAAALRTCTEPEEHAKLAMVAVHLDMIDDAVDLLERCGRYDLLNQLYQASGDWEKALDIAKTKDRIHLKPTHFAYAQHLEAMERVEEALSHFESSGTYRTESPRLLCSLGLTDDLEAYVERSDDTQLHRWYAQYLESKANLDGASREYRKAGDWLSLCRVACFNKDLDQAQKVCEDSQDQAACYHLARHLEAEGRIKDAIHYFQLAGRMSHALRLAQENNFDGDLMSLALSADPLGMTQAAKYYEQRGQPSKAVVLYQKAGHQKRALDLCFSAKLFDALRRIADDLSSDSDPEVLAKCAEFFMQHSQHDKAVHLLSMSHQYDRAVDLCMDHNVTITEEMAERMTPEKNSMDAAQRSDILSRMAQLCKKQGAFQLACKKFTQAGDKLKAMKCLLQSGDTEKIIFFAGTARQPDIYVLAGNYLQSLDWHNETEIMKNIIQFYSKAKAHDKLATFYDACAQVEIDEYRDYDKAAGALRESLKYLTKSVGGAAENDLGVQNLQSRIALVEKFAGIRKLAKSNPEEMVSVCEGMLDTQDIETAVRIGDIFAQLVEHFAETQNFPEAHRTVERMRQRGIVLTPYVDQALLEAIYRNVGQPVPVQAAGAGAPAHGQPPPDDDVGEDIEEDGGN